MNREEAWNLLRQYNKESFHLRHALTVEGIMRYFAKELGYADQEEYWGACCTTWILSCIPKSTA